MKYFTWCLLILCAASLQVSAQDCVCPDKLSVIEPAGLIVPGENFTFSAQIDRAAADGTTYTWTVDNGTITGGQGTRTITVLAGPTLEGSAIVATVTVSGVKWCSTCNNLTATGTAMIAQLPKPILADSFTRSNCEDLQARTDSFFNTLSNDPSASGYIYLYGRWRAIRVAENEFQNWLRTRRFDANRITFVRGGGNDDKAQIDMWIVPSGSEIPEPKAMAGSGDETDRSKKPYIFSSEYIEDSAGCAAGLDRDGFVEVLIANPTSRGNIVISEPTRAIARRREREIIAFIVDKGVARSRIRTFIRISGSSGMELWMLP